MKMESTNDVLVVAVGLSIYKENVICIYLCPRNDTVLRCRHATLSLLVRCKYWPFNDRARMLQAQGV